MRGVRRRLEADADARLALAWQTGAFTGAAHAGLLEPLEDYRRKARSGGKRTPKDMLAVLCEAQNRGMKMTIRKVD